MAVTRNFFIPADGHSLAATLREITDAGGAGVRVELKPQTPFAGDPEFDSSDLSAWTQANSANADAINADTKKSHLQIDSNATSTNWSDATRSGPFVHQTLSGDFDVYTRVQLGDIRDNHGVYLLAQSTSDATDWICVFMLVSGGVGVAHTLLVFRSTVNSATASQTVVNVSADQYTFAGNVYFRMKRASNDFSTYYSFNGSSWTQIGATTTRSDFSSDQKLGGAAITANTANACVVAFDFLRTWPPYVTTSPVGSVVIDSGVNGTTWDMSTFDALVNMYQEYNPQSQIGFGTLKFKYGALDTNPPSLNGSYLTETQMQAETDPVGRYFKLEVQYISANGYEQASFNGATIDASFAMAGAGRGVMRGM